MDGSFHLGGVREGFPEEAALNLRLEAEGRGGKQNHALGSEGTPRAPGQKGSRAEGGE